MILRILVFLLLTSPALAQEGGIAPLAGTTDPAYEAALTLWLDAREEEALPQFSALARGGNPAAQILLALIDVTAVYQGDWLFRLPREERIALMRQPGGLSGQSWMTAADEPLARAWLLLGDADAPMEVLLDFARLGETRAAAVSAKTLAMRQRHGFAALAEDPDFPPSLMEFAWREGAAASPDLSPPSENWRDDARLSLPLLAVCEAVCADEVDPCIAAAYQGVDGYPGLIALGSPAEALIPAERFLRSAQGQAAVLRTIALRQSRPAGPACLTDAVTAQK